MHRLHDQILCIAAQVVGTFASKIDLEALLISNLHSYYSGHQIDDIRPRS